jgi:hypothetical protein
VLQNVVDETPSVVFGGSLSLIDVFCPYVASKEGVFVVNQYD